MEVGGALGVVGAVADDDGAALAGRRTEECKEQTGAGH